MDDTKIDMDDVETLKALVATYREWMDEREKEIVSLRRQASTALAVMRGEREAERTAIERKADRLAKELAEVRLTAGSYANESKRLGKVIDDVRQELGAKMGELTIDAGKRVVAERDEARRERDILKDEHADLCDTLGVQPREDILDVAERVVRERNQARSDMAEYRRDIETMRTDLDAPRLREALDKAEMERDQALLEASRLACTSGPPDSVIVGQIEGLTSQLEAARATIASMKDEQKKMVEALNADEGADLVLVAKYVMHERREDRRRHLETASVLSKVMRERNQALHERDVLARAISQAHLLTQSLLKV